MKLLYLSFISLVVFGAFQGVGFQATNPFQGNVAANSGINSYGAMTPQMQAPYNPNGMQPPYNPNGMQPPYNPIQPPYNPTAIQPPYNPTAIQRPYNPNQRQPPYNPSPIQPSNYNPQPMHPNTQLNNNPVGGYAQPGAPPGSNMPGGPQFFDDTMGSEVENEWERCLDFASPEQLMQLGPLPSGDPSNLQVQTVAKGTSYKFTFMDQSTVTFMEKPNAQPDLFTINGGIPPPGPIPAGPIPASRPTVEYPSRPTVEYPPVTQNPSEFNNCASCVSAKFAWTAVRNMCMASCSSVAGSCQEDVKGCERMWEAEEEAKRCESSSDCDTCVDAGDSCVWDLTNHVCHSSAMGVFFQLQSVAQRANECPSNMRPQFPNAPARHGPAGHDFGHGPAGPGPIRPEPISGCENGSGMRPMPGQWTQCGDNINISDKWEEALQTNEESLTPTTLMSAPELWALGVPESTSSQLVADGSVNWKFTFSDGTVASVLENPMLDSPEITDISHNNWGKLQNTHRQGSSPNTSGSINYLLLATSLVGGAVAGTGIGLIWREFFMKKASNEDVYIDMTLGAQRNA